jgi:hypothetical protein
MSREAHVQFCESLGVRFPGATHLFGVILPPEDKGEPMFRADFFG